MPKRDSLILTIESQ